MIQVTDALGADMTRLVPAVAGDAELPVSAPTAARVTSHTTDATEWSIAAWHATAVRELARHTPVNGVCWACYLSWPCVTCARADVALAAW